MGGVFVLTPFGEKFTLHSMRGVQVEEQSETKAIHESEWLFSLEKLGREVYPPGGRKANEEGIPSDALSAVEVWKNFIQIQSFDWIFLFNRFIYPHSFFG